LCKFRTTQTVLLLRPVLHSCAEFLTGANISVYGRLLRPLCQQRCSVSIKKLPCLRNSVYCSVATANRCYSEWSGLTGTFKL